MRLPKDRGITGQSIEHKRVELVANGDYNILFANEVDNAIGLAVVRNCLIGPCIDNSGTLRGVIHLYNKMGVEPITI